MVFQCAMFPLKRCQFRFSGQNTVGDATEEATPLPSVALPHGLDFLTCTYNPFGFLSRDTN